MKNYKNGKIVVQKINYNDKNENIDSDSDEDALDNSSNRNQIPNVHNDIVKNIGLNKFKLKVRKVQMDDE